MNKLQRYAVDPMAMFRAVPLPWTDFQLGVFESLSPSLIALTAPKREPLPVANLWLEATKGIGKSLMVGLALCYAAAFARRPLYMQVGAADREQAGEVRKSIRDAIAMLPWLRGRLDIQQWKVICNASGSEIEIVAADVAGSHGARPDVVVIDEFTHATKRDFVLNLLDNAAKVESLVILAMNAGFLDTYQWDYRQHVLTSPNWQAHIFADLAPWLSERAIEEARQRNSGTKRFERLWQGVWTSNDGEGIAGLDKAIQPLPSLSAPEPGWVFYGGLDLATSGTDRAGLVVVAKDFGWTEDVSEPVELSPTQRTMIDCGIWDEPEHEPQFVHHGGSGRIRVAAVRSWRRPAAGEMIDLAAVRDELASLHAQLNFADVYIETPQAGLMFQELERAGVPVTLCHPTLPNQREMAVETIDLFGAGLVELPESESELIRDLRQLRIVEANNGRDFKFVAPRTSDGHADTATAFQLALLSARRSVSTAPRTVDRELIIWP